jgi:hypothetical protein
MAIQVNGTTVINNSRALNNISSIDANLMGHSKIISSGKTIFLQVTQFLMTHLLFF